MTLAAVPPAQNDKAGSVERSASLGKVTTRPSVAGDSAFMLELYASTSKDVLDDLGWSIGGQRTFVIMQAQAEEWNRARLYPGMDKLTICVDEMPVGRLLVCLRNNILHLVDLSLLPRYRGLGIGTQLMGEILNEARNARVPVKVRVPKVSSSVRFFEWLDFTTPTDLGSHVELNWVPPLSALGPNDHDDGFTSHGTRAHRPTRVEAPSDDTKIEAASLSDDSATGMASVESARVAARQAEEIVADVAAKTAAVAEARNVTDSAPRLEEQTAAELTEQPGQADSEDVVEEDPALVARRAEFLEAVSATEAFTSTIAAHFVAEVEEDDELPSGADRYNPFA